MARIGSGGGRTRYLGIFDTEDAAGDAYDAAAAERYGTQQPAKRSKGGRPVGEQRVNIPVRFTEAQAAALTALADELGYDRSAYIRHTVLRAHPRTASLCGMIAGGDAVERDETKGGV